MNTPSTDRAFEDFDKPANRKRRWVAVCRLVPAVSLMGACGGPPFIIGPGGGKAHATGGCISAVTVQSGQLERSVEVSVECVSTEDPPPKGFEWASLIGVYQPRDLSFAGEVDFIHEYNGAAGVSVVWRPEPDVDWLQLEGPTNLTTFRDSGLPALQFVHDRFGEFAVVDPL